MGIGGHIRCNRFKFPIIPSRVFSKRCYDEYILFSIRRNSILSPSNYYLAKAFIVECMWGRRVRRVFYKSCFLRGVVLIFPRNMTKTMNPLVSGLWREAFGTFWSMAGVFAYIRGSCPLCPSLVVTNTPELQQVLTRTMVEEGEFIWATAYPSLRQNVPFEIECTMHEMMIF